MPTTDVLKPLKIQQNNGFTRLSSPQSNMFKIIRLATKARARSSAADPVFTEPQTTSYARSGKTYAISFTHCAGSGFNVEDSKPEIGSGRKESTMKWMEYESLAAKVALQSRLSDLTRHPSPSWPELPEWLAQLLLPRLRLSYLSCPPPDPATLPSHSWDILLPSHR